MHFYVYWFVSCIPKGVLDTRSAGAGVAAGASAAIVAGKIKENLTPVYELHDLPIQVCEEVGDNVQCVVIPCVYENTVEGCIYTEPASVYWTKNKGRFTDVSTSAKQTAAISAFCKKNSELCLSYFGEYVEGSLQILLKK